MPIEEGKVTQREKHYTFENMPEKFFQDLQNLMEQYRAVSNSLANATVDPVVMLKELRAKKLAPAELSAKYASLMNQGPRIAAGIAEMLLEAGEPILAYDVAQNGLQHHPDDVGLKQVQALAFARSGAPAQALEILNGLIADDPNPVTCALIGGVHRDNGTRLADAGEKREAIECYRTALGFYEAACKKERQLWFLARSAVMAFLANNRDLANQRAQDVLTQAASSGKDEDPFWLYALTGEANLILGNDEQARQQYDQVAKLADRRYGDLASALRHAKLIVAQQGKSWDANPYLKMPPIAVLIGHMVDRAHVQISEGKPARFPNEIAIRVKSDIRRVLEEFKIRIGFASAASGSDLLFHEVIQEMDGGESIVVLPCHRDLFVEQSVRPGGADWLEKFKNVTQPPAQVITLSDQLFDFKGLSYLYGNMVLSGLAASKARQLGAELKFIAVWDGKTEGWGPGGTADNVARWRKAGHEPEIIDINAIRARYYNPTPLPVEPAPVPVPPAAAPPPIDGDFGAQITGILFADVAGFSRLTEKQLVLFVKHFLGEVRDLLDQTQIKVIKKNTWGDGLFFVFDNVKATGLFALELSERVVEKRSYWGSLGLPPWLDLRTGVHAGPVYVCIEPVTEMTNCIGMHVSRTARIEPVTPEGLVYASREFAAIAEAENIREFECNYIGQMDQAKKYGVFPTYHLRRRK